MGLLVVYLVLYYRSWDRSIGAAMSPEGWQSGYDAFVQTVFSFPCGYLNWIYRLPLNQNVLLLGTTILDGLFWALVAMIPVALVFRKKFITSR